MLYTDIPDMYTILPFSPCEALQNHNFTEYAWNATYLDKGLQRSTN